MARRARSERGWILSALSKKTGKSCLTECCDDGPYQRKRYPRGQSLVGGRPDDRRTSLSRGAIEVAERAVSAAEDRDGQG